MAGLLARRLRLGQLALAVAAMAAVVSCEFFRRYLVPAAVLQCAWAAAAAAVDVHKPRAAPPNRWALWASVVLDGVTAMATFAAASGAFGVAHAVVSTTTLCAQEPVLCRGVASEAPRALLAWAALQGPPLYFAAVQMLLLAREQAITSSTAARTS